MSSLIDHVALIKERLATQFKESPNIIGYLEAILKQANELETVLCNVADILDIDTAVGAQLDNIGALVGQPRAFLPAINNDAFTFDTGPGFDVGEFMNPMEELAAITDEEYRRWIRARIVSNTNNITPEDIIKSVQFVFGLDTPVIFTDGMQEYTIDIGIDITLSDRYLLEQSDILPRTAAVNGMYGVAFSPDTFRFDIGPGFDVGNFATEI